MDTPKQEKVIVSSGSEHLVDPNSMLEEEEGEYNPESTPTKAEMPPWVGITVNDERELTIICEKVTVTRGKKTKIVGFSLLESVKSYIFSCFECEVSKVTKVVFSGQQLKDGERWELHKVKLLGIDGSKAKVEVTLRWPSYLST